MENPTQVLEATTAPSRGSRGRGRSAVTLVVLIALIGAALALARDAGTPTAEEKTNMVEAVDAGAPAESGASAALRPQIGFGGLICATLNAIFNAFLQTPFFVFIANVLLSLRVSFGCVSG